MDLYKGHNITYSGQYPAIYLPKHVKAINNGTVYIHLLVAAEKIGRDLTHEECVHHVDGNKQNFDAANLWIFKTQADHQRYHSVLRNNIKNYILKCENGIMTCKITDKPNLCPICGAPISRKAQICLKCYKQYQAKNVPTKQELIDLARKHDSNFTRIGRLYGVSGNAVKKWFKKYGLYVPKT